MSLTGMQSKRYENLLCSLLPTLNGLRKTSRRGNYKYISIIRSFKERSHVVSIIFLYNAQIEEMTQQILNYLLLQCSDRLPVHERISKVFSAFQNQSKDSGYSTACDPVVGAAPKEAPSPAAGVAEETRERRHTGGNQSGGQEKHTHGPPPASPPPPVPGSQTHNKAHNVSKGKSKMI